MYTCPGNGNEFWRSSGTYILSRTSVYLCIEYAWNVNVAFSGEIIAQNARHNILKARPDSGFENAEALNAGS